MLKKLKILVSVFILTYSIVFICVNSNNKETKNQVIADTESNFIFIGGYPRSGTTLLRAILDVHPNIKCGPETIIIYRYLEFIKKYDNNTDLVNAGINKQIIDKASIEFIRSVLLNRGFKVGRQCAKDPKTFMYIDYLYSIFPNSKFIYVVRDGRAAAYSHIVNEFKTKFKYNSRLYSKYLLKWYEFNTFVSEVCDRIGPKNCITIKYESLVLEPEKKLRKIMKFLGETWNKSLLEHHNHIGNNILLSKTEWSSHQIVKPIHSESLNDWTTKVVLKESDMNLIEPLLKKFNYELNIEKINAKPVKKEKIISQNEYLIKLNQEKFEFLAFNVSEHLKKFNTK